MDENERIRLLQAIRAGQQGGDYFTPESAPPPVEASPWFGGPQFSPAPEAPQVKAPFSMGINPAGFGYPGAPTPQTAQIPESRAEKFNPMDGISSISSDEAPVEEVEEKPSQSGMSPDLMRKLASEYVTVGGGGASSSQSSTRTPLLPAGWNERLAAAGQAATSAEERIGRSEELKAKQEADIERRNFTSAQARQTAFAAKEKALQAKIDQADADYAAIRADVAATTIDPQKYWANQSTYQNVMTAIAMGLSAFGHAMQGRQGQDPVSSYIERQIDKDIEAQKANLAKKMRSGEEASGLVANLYSRFGNLYEAEQQARIMINDNFLSEYKRTAAEAKSDQARSIAALKSTELEGKILQMQKDAAGEKVVSRSASGGPVQKKSKLQLLQEMQMGALSGQTAMLDAQAKNLQAQANLEKAKGGGGVALPSPSAGSDTQKKIEAATGAMQSVQDLFQSVKSKGMLDRKVTPDFMTREQILQTKINHARLSAKRFYGEDNPLLSGNNSIYGGWDSGTDARQKMALQGNIIFRDAMNHLESVEDTMDTDSAKKRLKNNYLRLMRDLSK